MSALAHSPVSHERVGRGRRVLGWSCVVAGVLVAGVWGWSRWGCGHVEFGAWRVAVYRGMVYVLDIPTASQLLKPPPPAPTGDWARDRRLRNQYDMEKFREIERHRLLEIGWDRVKEKFDKPEWFMHGHTDVIASIELFKPGTVVVAAPLWMLPLALWAVAGVALWLARRSRRRALQGCCAGCGYPVAGVDGRCPECGVKV